MKKEYWYAITWQSKNKPVVVVGFRQALIFRRKEDAQAEFKKAGYKKNYKHMSGELWHYQIKRIAI